jgi:hypothetical protein
MRWSVPVIASGGVGTLDHLADGVSKGGADAVLAASIFHYGEFTVGQAKACMAQRGIPANVAFFAWLRARAIQRAASTLAKLISKCKSPTICHELVERSQMGLRKGLVPVIAQEQAATTC